MAQKRCLILGAVLVGAGIAVSVAVAGSSQASAPHPPVVDMTQPLPGDAGDRDALVPPGSGRRVLPIDAAPTGR